MQHYRCYRVFPDTMSKSISFLKRYRSKKSQMMIILNKQQRTCYIYLVQNSPRAIKLLSFGSPILNAYAQITSPPIPKIAAPLPTSIIAPTVNIPPLQTPIISPTSVPRVPTYTISGATTCVIDSCNISEGA